MNGTDLRSIAIPDTEDTVTTADGEIDGSDSVLNGTNRYYEPVSLRAEAGTMINVTMSSDGGNPELRLRGPNGTILAADGGDGNTAQFERVELNQTGQYTLVATSVRNNSGFEYTLTVERYVEPNFNGSMSSWDEESQYLDFARGYLLVAQSTSGGCFCTNNGVSSPNEAPGNLTEINYTANTEDDYVVVTYAMDPNATTYERLDIDSALRLAYTDLYQAYSNSNGAENASWVPDRIYQRGITYDGELYRTTYLELDWAQDYAENGEADNQSAILQYAFRQLNTTRYGPAHENYTQGGELSTTASEFPEETYANATDDAEAHIASPASLRSGRQGRLRNAVAESWPTPG
jgi:hypothetical protein